MNQTARPVSPHLQVYRWQIQMMISILHRATGVALAAGSLLLVCGLMALASGPEAWARFSACAGSPLGEIVLFGFTWSLALHLLNGLRHLAEDMGWGYEVPRFVMTGWVAAIGSLLLTAAVWACVLLRGGVA